MFKTNITSFNRFSPNMRIKELIRLSLMIFAAFADQCSKICEDFPFVCGSGGSHCKNAHVCHDLFWSTGPIPICSLETIGCTSEQPVLCDEARLAHSLLLALTEVPSSSSTPAPYFEEDPYLERALRMSLEDVGGSSDTGSVVETEISNGDIALEEKPGNPSEAEEKVEEEDPDMARALIMSLSGLSDEAPVLSEEEMYERAVQESLRSDNSGAESSYVADPRPGRLGIKNLGNTCYLSATLQVLGHSPRILSMLSSTNFVHPNPVQQAFVQILRDMWTKYESGDLLDPTALQSALFAYREGSAFHAGSTEDAHEAVRTILGLVSDAARNGGRFDKSPVDNLFDVSVGRPRVCSGCQNTRNKIEQEQDIFVAIPAPPSPQDSVSIYDCIETIREPETIPFVECPLCDGFHSATTQNKIVGASDVLLVFLRRFGNDGVKIHTKVETPLILEMSRITRDSSSPNYRLVGAIHHRGESRLGGHYVAQFFHPDHNEWVDANDRSVVTHEGSIETTSSTAYILVYERA